MHKEEFQRLVMVCQDKMYRFAFTYMKSEAEAKDVVQDVLMKLWETRSTLKEKRNIEAWAMTLTKNKSLDKLKRVGKKYKSELDQETYHLQSDGSSPLASLTDKEGLGLVKQILLELPENQASAFSLRELDGYSYAEISDVLEMNLNQVKVNIFRARKAVKLQLENTYAYGQ